MAVAGALAKEGAKSIVIANRTLPRAERLSRVVRERYPNLQTACFSFREAEKMLNRFDWVVQATSVGLRAGDPSPLGLKAAQKGTWVVDLIYHRKTAFLQEAEKRNLPYLDGLGMLLHQGAISFERWTDMSAPLAAMKRAMRDGLSSR